MASDTDIEKNLRNPISKRYDDIDEKILQYAAGFIDADGCLKVCKGAGKYKVQFAVDQSEKGVAAIHFLYDNFGGSINLHMKGDEKKQTSYSYVLNGDDAIYFFSKISKYLLLKKNQALKILEFPNNNLLIIPIIAKNTETNEEREYETLDYCSKSMGYVKLAFKKQDKIICGDWEIKKKFTKEEIDQIKRKREELYLLLKEMKTIPHEEIPDDIEVSDAYFAGFFDGDGRFNTNGKSAQNHRVDQKYPQICKLFQKTFGGTVCYCKSKNQWNWEIYTGANEFVKRIAPYIVGKKKQAELILNMNPGESSKVHAELRDLKGKGKMKTPEIDSINGGNPQYTTPVRKLPKGVFKNNSTEYRAQIQHNKKIYNLGVFTDINEAHQKYLEVKRGIIMAKVNKQEYDMTGYHLSTTKP